MVTIASGFRLRMKRDGAVRQLSTEYEEDRNTGLLV